MIPVQELELLCSAVIGKAGVLAEKFLAQFSVAMNKRRWDRNCRKWRRKL